MSDGSSSVNNLCDQFNDKFNKKVIFKLNLSNSINDSPQDHQININDQNTSNIQQTPSIQTDGSPQENKNIQAEFHQSLATFPRNSSNPQFKNIVRSPKDFKRILNDFEHLPEPSKSKYFESLEDTMAKCSETIDKIDNHEFSLEEMGNDRSLWIQGVRYSNQLNKLHRLEHKLRHKTVKVKRKVFAIKDDKLPALVKRRVDGFINGRLRKPKLECVELGEIGRVVREAHGEMGVELRERELDLISEGVHLKVLEQLQRMRVKTAMDFLDEFVEGEDPAEGDQALRDKLVSNDDLHQAKMDSVRNIIEDVKNE